jgi:hypothetical protein
MNHEHPRSYPKIIENLGLPQSGEWFSDRLLLSFDQRQQHHHRSLGLDAVRRFRDLIRQIAILKG